MRATAEAARGETIQRADQEAAAYLEQIQSRRDDDIAAFRSACEADITAIRERSKERVDKIRMETEARIGRRRETLTQSLKQHDAVIEQELQRVENRIKAFEDQLTDFFNALMARGDTDPVVFANMASMMPTPPDFEAEANGTVAALQPAAQPTPSPLPGTTVVAAPGVPSSGNGNGPKAEPVRSNGNGQAPLQAPVQAPVKASNREPLLPGNLWGAGAVRGRLYSEWYPEAERLIEIGDEAAAIELLLDVVLGAEAGSYAEGTRVPARPYEQLAVIYRSRGDVAGEYSILERYARQEQLTHGQFLVGEVDRKLLERYNFLKKQLKH